MAKTSKIKCKCDSCGKTIKVAKYKYTHNKNHFCNWLCYTKHRKLDSKNSEIIKYCAYCGKELHISKSKQGQQINYKNTFCNRTCMQLLKYVVPFYGRLPEHPHISF